MTYSSLLSSLSDTISPSTRGKVGVHGCFDFGLLEQTEPRDCWQLLLQCRSEFWANPPAPLRKDSTFTKPGTPCSLQQAPNFLGQRQWEQIFGRFLSRDLAMSCLFYQGGLTTYCGREVIRRLESARMLQRSEPRRIKWKCQMKTEQKQKQNCRVNDASQCYGWDEKSPDLLKA